MMFISGQSLSHPRVPPAWPGCHLSRFHLFYHPYVCCEWDRATFWASWTVLNACGFLTDVKIIYLYFFLYFSHVINELIETERVYVEELFTVLTVSDFFRLLILVPRWLVPKGTCHSIKLSNNVIGKVSTKLSDPKLVINFSSFLPSFSLLEASVGTVGVRMSFSSRMREKPSVCTQQRW